MNSKMDEALSDDIKDKIRDALQNIKANTKGFRDRPSQRKLIAEVARTLSGFYGRRRILVAEAPTGTGKSIGYMLGAIPVAMSLEKRIVIATGTVALQEQLVNRDIPSLQQQSGLDFTFMLAKGRGRYACNRNIAELTNSDARQTSLLGDDMALDSAAWPFVPKEEQVKLVMDMERALEAQSWSGDLDEWTGAQVEDDMRQLIATDHGGCLGRSCKHFYQCAFHKSRGAMKKADVIVANHDLVMADINLGGGAILPEPEETIYIFDEAHHLPDVALEHGSSETYLRRAQELATKTPKLLSEALSALKVAPDKAKKMVDSVREAVEELNKGLKEAEIFVAANFPAPSGRKPPKGEPVVWRFQNGVPPEALRTIAGNVLKPAEKITSAVNSTLEGMREAFKKQQIEQGVATKVGKNLSFQRARLETLVDTWQMMGAEDEPGRPPVARWVTHLPLNRGRREDYVVSCCPTSAAGLLRSALWDKAAGVVLASATVTALGNFNRFAERAGLGLRDGTQYLSLPSPFNYEENGELYVPQMRHDPSDPDKHTAEVIDLLNAEIDPSQGTLVLFSARRQMQEVAEKLTDSLKPLLLVQGDKSKNEILQIHGERIRAGQGSIIFGLASFSEGVDLPGKLCEHVIIAKLPFAVPDSPVDATYSEWLESVGRNPFMEIAVPDACTKLVQACGRLIRTESDTGRVTLLDKRIVTKRYGGQILNSLPPFYRRIEPTRRTA
jgi:ATP-dependent DNA helicase DinG